MHHNHHGDGGYDITTQGNDWSIYGDVMTCQYHGDDGIMLYIVERISRNFVRKVIIMHSHTVLVTVMVVERLGPGTRLHVQHQVS